ncbi:MAG TPA: hypothetical protein VGL46_13275 [Pseudonocardiaceae bacterium]|jgi:hypothetical protein
MTTVYPGDEAKQSIVDALTGVQVNGANILVTDDPGKSLASFPAAVISVPLYDWTANAFNNPDPDQATFVVAVVFKANAYVAQLAQAALFEVTRALDKVHNLDLTQAVTGTFPQGATQLPCYYVTCEVTL